MNIGRLEESYLQATDTETTGMAESAAPGFENWLAASLLLEPAAAEQIEEPQGDHNLTPVPFSALGAESEGPLGAAFSATESAQDLVWEITQRSPAPAQAMATSLITPENGLKTTSEFAIEAAPAATGESSDSTLKNTPAVALENEAAILSSLVNPSSAQAERAASPLASPVERRPEPATMPAKLEAATKFQRASTQLNPAGEFKFEANFSTDSAEAGKLKIEKAETEPAQGVSVDEVRRLEQAETATLEVPKAGIENELRVSSWTKESSPEPQTGIAASNINPTRVKEDTVSVKAPAQSADSSKPVPGELSEAEMVRFAELLGLAEVEVKVATEPAKASSVPLTAPRSSSILTPNTLHQEIELTPTEPSQPAAQSLRPEAKVVAVEQVGGSIDPHLATVAQRPVTNPDLRLKASPAGTGPESTHPATAEAQPDASVNLIGQPVNASLEQMTATSEAENAAAPTISPEALIEQIAAGIKQQAGREIKLMLRPDHLGPLQIRLTSVNGTLMANIMPEQELVQRLLKQHLPQLHQALTEAGVVVAELSVTTQSPLPVSATAAESGMTMQFTDHSSPRPPQPQQASGYSQPSRVSSGPELSAETQERPATTSAHGINVIV